MRRAGSGGLGSREAAAPGAGGQSLQPATPLSESYGQLLRSPSLKWRAVPMPLP